MAEYTEESLNNLTKPELVSLKPKVCKKMETFNEDLVSDILKLNDSFKTVECDLAVTKIVNSLPMKRLNDTEKQS